jgi:hypothetical protein
VTAVSNVVDGSWLIGGSDGTIRLVSAPDKVHLTIKPKNMAVLVLIFTADFVFHRLQRHMLLNLTIELEHRRNPFCIP